MCRNIQEIHFFRLFNTSKIEEKTSFINRQIQQIEERQKRLLDAIEKGAIELDEMTLARSQDLKRSKEALVIEKHHLKHSNKDDMPELRASQIEKLSKMLKSKLLNDNQDVAKGYLKLLVDEVQVSEESIKLAGPVIGVLQAAKNLGGENGYINQVPTSLMDWHARRESNPRPLASETNTLSN